jgi:hypothetical protein
MPLRSILKRKDVESNINEDFDEEYEKMKMEVKKSIIDLISYSNNIKFYQSIFNNIKGRMDYINRIHNDKTIIIKYIETNKSEIVELNKKIKNTSLNDIKETLEKAIITKQQNIEDNKIKISQIDKDIKKIQNEIKNIIVENKLDEKFYKIENIKSEILSINKNIDTISKLKQKIINKIEKYNFSKDIFYKLEKEILESHRNAKKRRIDFLSSLHNEEIEITPSRIRSCNEENPCPDGYDCKYINIEEGICEKVKKLSVDEKISPTKYDSIKKLVMERRKKVKGRTYKP